jgi:peptidoglycan/xylan/chitin deacetylase (PgdA/CDA1 family)
MQRAMRDDASPARKRRFVVTVDDPGGLIQDVQTLRRALDFFNEEAVPATFFVVPRGKGGWQIDRAEAWLAIAREAERRGHNCQLHGLEHASCEFGTYPTFIRAMSGDPSQLLRTHHEQFGRGWRRDLFAEKLSAAIRLFENAFARRPQVLRTGALSQSPALYEAVADVGMRYVSNRVVDPRGWAYIAGRYDAPGDWDPSVPPGPYCLTEKVIDLPMISEYAWRLTPEKVERHLALALEDLGRVYAAQGVFLLICHVQEVGAAETSLPRDLVRRLLAAARQDYGAVFQTLSQLIAGVEAGEVQVRPYEARKEEGGCYDVQLPF